jgi:hypothetical protein
MDLVARSPVCEEKYETRNKIRFRGFSLTQLHFNRYLLFYLIYPLHVSVVDHLQLEIHLINLISVVCISTC